MLLLTLLIGIILMIYFVKWIIKKIYIVNTYLSHVILYAFILFFIITIMIKPRETINAALNGMQLWTTAVFPSLFPFFVSTELLIHLGFVSIIGVLLEPVMRPLFNVPGTGAFAFSLGIISGYPLGAKTAVNLCQNNLCSETEAERLLTFCNNAGPLFILGSVATAMFNHPSIGVLLFTAHLFSSLTVGLLFRFYKFKTSALQTVHTNKRGHTILKEMFLQIKRAKEKETRSFGEIFGDSIYNAIHLLLLIAGFIVFFSVFISLLNHLHVISFLSRILGIMLLPLGIDASLMPAMVSGFFEITTGIKMASSCTSVALSQRLIVTSLILGWAGLSVHCQVISIVSKSNIRIMPYIIGKALQGIIAALYTFILLHIIPLNQAAFALFYNPHKIHQSSTFASTIGNSFKNSLVYLGNVLFALSLCCFIIAIIQAIVFHLKTKSP